MPKLSENHVRRLARRAGYALRKSRARNLNLNDHGDYMLIEASRNVAVLGSNFEATLDDIEAFLRKAA
jgi:hypothetical protein